MNEQVQDGETLNVYYETYGASFLPETEESEKYPAFRFSLSDFVQTTKDKKVEFRLKQTKRPGSMPDLFKEATQYYLLLDMYIDDVQYEEANQRAIAIPGRVSKLINCLIFMASEIMLKAKKPLHTLPVHTTYY